MSKNASYYHPSLKGKCALVTGAGSGIGKGTALALAQAGAKVGLLDLNETDLKAVHAKIKEAGGEALMLVADITDRERMDAIAASLIEAYGPPEIVFANAGINGRWAAIDDFEDGEWEQIIDVNLKGTYQTIRCVMPAMKASGQGGSIIITASINGYRIFTNIGASAYSVTKSGLVTLAQMLALELAKHRIRVNAVAPGAIQSNISESTDRDNEDILEPVIYPEGAIPLTDGKPGTPADIADTVCFLASDAAKHISGTVVTVDGAESLLQG